jgi:hypothetical protein
MMNIRLPLGFDFKYRRE